MTLVSPPPNGNSLGPTGTSLGVLSPSYLSDKALHGAEVRPPPSDCVVSVHLTRLGTPYKNSLSNALSRLMCPGHHSCGSLRGRPHPSEVTALVSPHFPTSSPQHASPCPSLLPNQTGATPYSGAHGVLILSSNDNTPSNVNAFHTNS